jgi:hypothetical protein
MKHALNWLENHADPLCAELGAAARARMTGGDYSYDASATSFGYMYASQPKVFLGGSSFGTNELANTIAHEEWHHKGYADYEPDGRGAYAIGDLCGAGYTS